MAKDINQKQKRITHIKSGFQNNIGGKCLDYVSSIIKDMDSDILSVQSRKMKSQSKVKNLTEYKKDSFTASKHKDNTPSITMVKEKKFGIARKFPLMEKSQKILKHIRHNQKIPKQRAHLASIPQSPMKITPRVSMQKSNRDKQDSNFKRNKNGHCSKIDSSISPWLIKETTVLCQNESSMPSTSKMPKLSCKKVKVNVEHNNVDILSEKNNKNDVHDDNSDTTDGEYERFIQKNKKQLKKKTSKQKAITAVKRPSKGTAKKKKILKLSDSEPGDDESLPHDHQKLKMTDSMNGMDYSVHHSDAESDLMDGDIYSRDTSSDDDTRSALVNVADSIPIIVPGSQFIGTDNYEFASETQTLHVKNDVSDTNSEYTLFDTCSYAKTDLLDSTSCLEQDTFPADNSTIICKNTGDNKLENVLCDFSSSFSSEIQSRNIIAQSDHDESDLEIIDVVWQPKKSKPQDCLNNVLGKVSKNDITIETVSSMCSVKNMEIYNQIQIKVEGKQQNDDDSSMFKAAYSTDICKEYDKESNPKICVIKQSENTILNNETPLINKEIKKEEEEEDDDIIFDGFIPGKNLNGKFSSCTPNKSFVYDKQTRIKTEMLNIDPVNDFIGNDGARSKDLKLHEVACSNLSMTKGLLDKQCDKLTSTQSHTSNTEEITIKNLIEAYKQEFQTYQDILETTENLEASMKSLESRQAVKVQKLQALIQDCLENKNDNKIIEQLKLMCKQPEELSDLQTPEGRLPAMYSSQSVLKNLPNFQISIPSPSIVLPTSIMEDVKPDLLLLDISKSVVFQQSLTSQKPPSASSQSANLFGEKCNVCNKEAIFACQKCAKVFFCSDPCGKKFWADGHEDECGK